MYDTLPAFQAFGVIEGTVTVACWLGLFGFVWVFWKIFKQMFHWENPRQMYKTGELGVTVGDIVRMNPDSMVYEGLALVIGFDQYGLFNVFCFNGRQTTADDRYDIVEIVSKNVQ